MIMNDEEAGVACFIVLYEDTEKTVKGVKAG
jgi:hypothetical protein